MNEKLTEGSEPSCGLCKFFEAEDDRCKFNPPVIVDALIKIFSKDEEIKKCNLVEYASVSPVVSEYDWCGKFEKRETT